MANQSTKSDETNELRQDLDTLKKDMLALRDDLKGFSRDAAEQGQKSAHRAREYAQEQWEESVDTVQTYVRERPVTSLGVAFVSGIAVALLLGRK